MKTKQHEEIKATIAKHGIAYYDDEAFSPNWDKNSLYIIRVKDGYIKKKVGNIKVINGVIHQIKDKTNYLPVFDISKLPENFMKDYKKTPSKNYQEGIERANKYPEYHLKTGERIGEDGEKELLITEYDYYHEIFYDDEKEKWDKRFDGIYIGCRYSEGNLGTTEHFVLSERIPSRLFYLIKDYFEYVDMSKWHDEIWGSNFKGYQIKKELIPELEDLLNIKRTRSKIQEEKEWEKESKAKNKARYDFFMKSIDELFNPKDSIAAEDEVRLTSERIYIDDKDMDGNNIVTQGLGSWFQIESDFIWKVQNNGHDSCNWELNNVLTQGAGAIGWKFEKTQDRLDFIELFKKEMPDLNLLKRHGW